MRTVPNPAETVVDMPPVTDPPPIPKRITHWHGHATGSWWAIVPSRVGLQLVEAVSADALAVTVDWYLRGAAW